MITLRTYQNEAIEQIRESFKTRKSQYIQLPTGAGKTVTFLSYAQKYHKKTLIVVPSRELLRQVYESALLFFDPKNISRKGAGYEEFPRDVHICVINSTRGKYAETIRHCKFDLVVIDEVHHVQAQSYRNLLKEFDWKPSILGVTATPDRTDGQLIESLMEECSYKLETAEMIERGFLSDIEGYVVKTGIDLSDIGDHNGDFSLNQLFKKLCTNSRNQLILDLCKKDMFDRKTLIFCINIAHSKMVSRLLNESGISAAHIDGKMNRDARSSILTAFRNGEISYLCNCQLLTEGFDEPSIDGIILARPTRSRALFNQMIGRGLRLFPGKKNCKIIDVVDNHKNLRGYNCLIDDMNYNEIESFKNIKDIKDHIEKERFSLTEFSIIRADLLSQTMIDEEYAVPSMIDYLKNNNIKYFEPLSFHEGSFLVWFNKLQKEYAHGNNC